MNVGWLSLRGRGLRASPRGAVSGLLAETASRPWVGRRADQVDLRAHSPLITGS